MRHTIIVCLIAPLLLFAHPAHADGEAPPSDFAFEGKSATSLARCSALYDAIGLHFDRSNEKEAAKNYAEMSNGAEIVSLYLAKKDPGIEDPSAFVESLRETWADKYQASVEGDFLKNPAIAEDFEVCASLEDFQAEMLEKLKKDFLQ
jgi:hypothetical protein